MLLSQALANVSLGRCAPILRSLLSAVPSCVGPAKEEASANEDGEGGRGPILWLAAGRAGSWRLCDERSFLSVKSVKSVVWFLSLRQKSGELLSREWGKRYGVHSPDNHSLDCFPAFSIRHPLSSIACGEPRSAPCPSTMGPAQYASG